MRARCDESGERAIVAALEAGARLLDTANVYFGDGGQLGDNEKLVARALARWAGDRSEVTVATKGGLTRRGPRWLPDGRARALREACEASVEALGSDAIDLYLLHAPDPKVSWSTSVRALAELRDAGLATAIGLCNVGVGQLDAALEVTSIDAVQIALNPFDIKAVRGGLVERCLERSIRIIAHSPLGGPKGPARLRRHDVIAAQADRLGWSPEAVALAWLADLPGEIVAIPGSSQPARAREAVAAQALALDAELRERLDDALHARPLLAVDRSVRRGTPDVDGSDVVVIMGTPGAGKSTIAGDFVRRGYARLNRDQRGGTLAKLIGPLKAKLARGERRIVLDNTYATRASRNEVIEAAWSAGAPVRCVVAETSLEDAQINAVTRMLDTAGEFPSPELIRARSRKMAGFYAPSALFNYRRSVEEPNLDEGFESIERRAFVRERREGREARALILGVDGVLRTQRSGAPRPMDPADVVALPGRAEVLARYRRDGWLLLGVSWQPEIGSGALDQAVADACFERTCALLGVDVEFFVCPHVAGPPKCWCRRPLPGLGVLLSERFNLDHDKTLVVGRSQTDALWATRLGFGYQDADDFFATSPPT